MNSEFEEDIDYFESGENQKFEGLVKFKDLNKFTNHLEKNKEKFGSPTCIKVSEDGLIGFGTSKNYVLLFHEIHDELSATIFGNISKESKHKITCFDLKKNVVIAGDNSGKVFIWNIHTQKLLYKEKLSTEEIDMIYACGDSAFIISSKNQAIYYQYATNIILSKYYISNTIVIGNAKSIAMNNQFIALGNSESTSVYQINGFKFIERIQNSYQKTIPYLSWNTQDSNSNFLYISYGFHVIQVKIFGNPEDGYSYVVSNHFEFQSEVLGVHCLYHNIFAVITFNQIDFFDPNVEEKNFAKVGSIPMYSSFKEKEKDYYFNSSCVVNGNLHILGDEILCLTIKSWRERIQILEEKGMIEEAIQTSIKFSRFEGTGICGLPLNMADLKSLTNEVTQALIIKFFKQNLDQENIEEVLEKCIDYGLNIDKPQIFQMIKDNFKGDKTILTKLFVDFLEFDHRKSLKYFLFHFDEILKYCIQKEKFRVILNVHYLKDEYLEPILLLFSFKDTKIDEFILDGIENVLKREINVKSYEETKEMIIKSIIFNANYLERLLKYERFFKILHRYDLKDKILFGIVDILQTILIQYEIKEIKVYKSKFSFESQVNFFIFLCYSSHKIVLSKEMISLTFLYITEDILRQEKEKKKLIGENQTTQSLMTIIDLKKERESDLQKIIINQKDFDVDLLIGYCESVEFYNILSFLYQKKNVIDQTLYSYLKARNNEIFEYIQDKFKVEKDRKWIIDKYLKNLLEFNADLTVKKVIVPFFSDVKSQEKIISLLSDEKDLFIYLKELLNVEKKQGRKLMDENVKYQFLFLLCQYSPEDVTKFLKEQPHLDIPKCLDICKDLPVSQAYLYEKFGDIKTALSLMLKSVKTGIEKLKIKLIEESKNYDTSEYDNLKDFDFDSLSSTPLIKEKDIMELKEFKEISMVLSKCLVLCQETNNRELWFSLLDSILYLLRELRYGFFGMKFTKVELNEEWDDSISSDTEDQDNIPIEKEIENLKAEIKDCQFELELFDKSDGKRYEMKENHIKKLNEKLKQKQKEIESKRQEEAQQDRDLHSIHKMNKLANLWLQKCLLYHQNLIVSEMIIVIDSISILEKILIDHQGDNLNHMKTIIMKILNHSYHEISMLKFQSESFKKEVIDSDQIYYENLINGIKIGEKCIHCKNEIKEYQKLRIFRCGHSFHLKCCHSQGKLISCGICNEKKFQREEIQEKRMKQEIKYKENIFDPKFSMNFIEKKI